MKYDFGVIFERNTITHVFHFVNGDHAILEILSAKASCGYTLHRHPFLGIEIGEKGTMGVQCISIGKEGDQEATTVLPMA